MAGVPVPLVGRALLHFEIGSVTMDHPVYFTDSACIPTVANSYNMIMGNDLLSRLPPWSINYNKKAFHIADQQVNILSNKPETSEEHETIPVRVAKTIVLSPSSETFVPCFTDTEEESALVLTCQSESLHSRSLLVTPAVIRSGHTHILVSNPGSSPEVLYKGQRFPLPSKHMNRTMVPLLCHPDVFSTPTSLNSTVDVADSPISILNLNRSR
ncbi:hypothetical protein ANCDUO_13033 [Ancylostoma duodenale]|uniref:Uncharacterized protein n=1 Tax=Ancylostoma duodenale TaxID=51022 RepID=A0A0C2GD20_9BILA|nr:hypothetical protein ANCDUO_13033 [Ancylostoma duodenale]